MPRGVYDRSKAKKRSPKKKPEQPAPKAKKTLTKDLAKSEDLEVDVGGKYYVLDSTTRKIVYESNDFYKACDYKDIDVNYMVFARKDK